MGIGSYPKLSFDRREVILPTVPLNTLSINISYSENFPNSAVISSKRIS